MYIYVLVFAWGLSQPQRCLIIMCMHSKALYKDRLYTGSNKRFYFLCQGNVQMPPHTILKSTPVDSAVVWPFPTKSRYSNIRRRNTKWQCVDYVAKPSSQSPVIITTWSSCMARGPLARFTSARSVARVSRVPVSWSGICAATLTIDRIPAECVTERLDLKRVGKGMKVAICRCSKMTTISFSDIAPSELYVRILYTIYVVVLLK